MMKSSTLFEHGPLPRMYTSCPTRRHSHDRCSQGFPIFHHSSASIYYTEGKLKNKKQGRAGNEGRPHLMTIVGQVRYRMALEFHRSKFLQAVIYDNFIEIVVQAKNVKPTFGGIVYN